MGRGRPDKYKSHVEPYLEDIKKMARIMSERQIAKTLGVGYTSFRSYKSKYPALVDTLKKGRAELVTDLKSALIKKAIGYDYEETKTKIEQGIVTEVTVIKKRVPPDVAAINLLLKNYDETWYNDPKEYQLKKELMELQKKKAEEGSW